MRIEIPEINVLPPTIPVYCPVRFIHGPLLGRVYCYHLAENIEGITKSLVDETTPGILFVPVSGPVAQSTEGLW